MSDESAPSSGLQTSTNDASNSSRAQGGNGGSQDRRSRNRRAFNKKRESFLADLMRSIDMLVYAELSAIYYMDCSFLRLVVRALVQFVLLTPKSAIFPEPPQNRPIGIIFGSNILCILLHMLLSAPQASEATRGYLHGGLAMDFIGQKGPSSKLHLVFLDFLVLGLQLVNLGVLLIRQKAKEASESPTATPACTTTPVTAAPAQTLEFEERGQHSSDHQPVDIELQNMNTNGRGEPTNEETSSSERERETLLASSTSSRASDSHIFDAFNSGEIMIADLNLPAMIVGQFLDYRHPLPQAGNPVTSGMAAASFTRTGTGFRIRVGNRIWGV